MQLYILIFLSVILPWVIGINIYKTDPKTILLVAPFSAMLSFVMNTPGIEYGFFYPLPISTIKTYTLSILPSIGSFCILPCIFIYSVRHWKIHLVTNFILFTAIGSLADLIYLGIGFLKYGKGWNIVYSALTFPVAFGIVYLYYKQLQKFNIL